MRLRTPNYKRLKKKRIGFYQATFWLAELHQTPETGLPHICQGRGGAARVNFSAQCKSFQI